jgi:hypothetical protein
VFSVTAGKLFLCCVRHVQVRELTLSRYRTEFEFDRRDSVIVSDALLFYPDLLINVYDLPIIPEGVRGDWGWLVSVASPLALATAYRQVIVRNTMG